MPVALGSRLPVCLSSQQLIDLLLANSPAMSSSEATQLKLKALERKKAGDLDGAKQLLAQARAIEFESITVEDLNDAGEL